MKIDFKVEQCDRMNNQRKITYINCRVNDNNEKFDKEIECSFIPNSNYKGIMITSVSLTAVIIECILFILTIM